MLGNIAKGLMEGATPMITNIVAMHKVGKFEFNYFSINNLKFQDSCNEQESRVGLSVSGPGSVNKVLTDIKIFFELIFYHLESQDA